MDEYEIRVKAAELSTTMTAHMVSAMIARDGLSNLVELTPLAFAPEFERYILTGNLPKPIKVETKVK